MAEMWASEHALLWVHAAVAELSRFIPSMAALTELNVSMNDIGLNGAQTLAAAVPGSALRCIVAGTFCCVREGATTGLAVTEGRLKLVQARFHSHAQPTRNGHDTG